MTESQLRDVLIIALEYSHEREDWVFPLEQAQDGLTADQAAWRPGPELMGVWDIVLHLAVWNENIIERIQTGQNTHPAEGAWPARGEKLDELEWSSAKERLRKSIADLRQLLQTVPMEKIERSPYGFPDLLCRFTHLGYHLGQIEKLRECKGW